MFLILSSVLDPSLTWRNQIRQSKVQANIQLLLLLLFYGVCVSADSQANSLNPLDLHCTGVSILCEHPGGESAIFQMPKSACPLEFLLAFISLEMIANFLLSYFHTCVVLIYFFLIIKWCWFCLYYFLLEKIQLLNYCMGFNSSVNDPAEGQAGANVRLLASSSLSDRNSSHCHTVLVLRSWSG